MSSIRFLGERAQAMIDALAAISSEPGRLTRLYLSPEHRRAADLVGEWMRRIGLAVRIDAAGTVHGLLPATANGPRAAKRLLVGSHIDTIIDAGRYDGILGVVAGILAAEEILARGVTLPFGLEILAFGDEEGVRFPKTLTSSSAIAGVLHPSVLAMTDANGETLRQALSAFGCDPDGILDESYVPGEVIAYLEAHIEQGPVLDRAGEALGVVSAIASQGRYRVTVEGEAGHAGTVPMAIRRDALAATAEMILAVEESARAQEAMSLVATVGELTVRPGASNVIPGEARFSLDVRAATDAARDAAVAGIREAIARIGKERRVATDMTTVMEKPVAICAPWLRLAIGRAIETTVGKKPRELMSGAGHDGQAMIGLTDIGMIFVRCRDGISHNPLEFVTVDDLGLAVEALMATIVEIAATR
jgi:allantoate deiminase